MATTTTTLGFSKQADGDRDWNTVSIHDNIDRAEELFGGHVRHGSGTPTIAAGTGAGTTPTVAVAGSDVAGLITITTGTTPAASATVVTVTFGVPFAVAPQTVSLPPAGPSAAALSGNGQVYADAASLTTTAFVVKVGSAALAASTQYKWFYRVVA